MAETKDKIVTVESLKTVYDTLNENKAPAGFGLGEESLREVTLSDLDSLDGNGWYLVDNNQTGIAVNNVYFNYALLRVSSTNTGWNVIQELFTLTSDRTKIVRSRKSNTEWYGWECENPPMVANREYCTMERHKSLPVYVKLIDINALPNSTSASFPTNISGFNGLVSIDGAVMSSSAYNPIGMMDDITDIWLNGTGTSLSIKTKADLSARSATIYLKYTKSN